MKTEMEAARDAAFEKIFNEPIDDSHEAMCFTLGFDLGAEYAARSSQWVAVKSADNLPKESGAYLVSLRNGLVKMSYFYIGLSHDGPWDIQTPAKEVLAWQPLPEPYTADSGREGE
jgi:hypothetical protein